MPTFSEKIKGKNLVYYNTGNGVRIVYNERKGMYFDEVKKIVEDYNSAIKFLKGQNIDFNQVKLNKAIDVTICGQNVTIGFLFRLHNEIIDNMKLSNRKYTKLYYEKENSLEICPI